LELYLFCCCNNYVRMRSRVLDIDKMLLDKQVGLIQTQRCTEEMTHRDNFSLTPLLGEQHTLPLRQAPGWLPGPTENRTHFVLPVTVANLVRFLQYTVEANSLISIWKWVVSFTTRPLYLPRNILPPRSHWTRGWVDPQSRKREKRCYCRDRNPSTPARSPSLYRLSRKTRGTAFASCGVSQLQSWYMCMQTV
jgi:hypothetical protein